MGKSIDSLHGGNQSVKIEKNESSSNVMQSTSIYEKENEPTYFDELIFVLKLTIFLILLMAIITAIGAFDFTIEATISRFSDSEDFQSIKILRTFKNIFLICYFLVYHYILLKNELIVRSLKVGNNSKNLEVKSNIEYNKTIRITPKLFYRLIRIIYFLYYIFSAIILFRSENDQSINVLIMWLCQLLPISIIVIEFMITKKKYQIVSPNPKDFIIKKIKSIRKYYF